MKRIFSLALVVLLVLSLTGCGRISSTMEITCDTSQVYTTADIHEQDLEYLATCRRTGKAAAEFYGWTVIECVRDGAMRSIEDIHEEISRHIAACLED